MNSENNRIVFVPACLLCPLLMAKKGSHNELWRDEILSFLNKEGCSIIQMPCPEASFPNFSCGISRRPHGIKFYEELTGFKEHCYKLGNQVLIQIDAFYDNRYKVSAIIGIEDSPTCAVNYMYTNQGRQKRKGVFIQYLSSEFQKRGYDIPIIGINRRYPQKAIQVLKEIM